MRKRSEAKLANHIHLRISGVTPPSPYAFHDWLIHSYTIFYKYEISSFFLKKKRVTEVLTAKEFLVLFSSFGSSFQTPNDQAL